MDLKKGIKCKLEGPYCVLNCNAFKIIIDEKH